MSLVKIWGKKYFFKANESDEMAFRSISLNLSIAYVKQSTTELILDQLNHIRFPLYKYLLASLVYFLCLNTWVSLKKQYNFKSKSI